MQAFLFVKKEKKKSKGTCLSRKWYLEEFGWDSYLSSSLSFYFSLEKYFFLNKDAPLS